ncbi:hypothetical protein ACFPOA_09645 [Lysobacter niabensis]|uniref:hypothetical protein n=1 Tax=Agrilutibacter niabensis TaxID=380628 RepID=UPI003607DD2C
MAITPTTDTRGRNRWRPLIWGGAALLLLLPAVAMQFTQDVVWGAEDFIATGVMLLAACGLYELATWLSGNTVYRAAFGIAVVAGYQTVWVNVAVGVFGSENSALNLMFGGVLLVAALGALFARLRARGMAWAMGATAAAQLLAAGIGLAIGLTIGLTIGTDEVGGPNIGLATFLAACFAVPWLVSARLFRKAAQDKATN